MGLLRSTALFLVTVATHPGPKGTQSQAFYVCLGNSWDWSQRTKCGDPESFFCATRGGESTGWISWKPLIKDDLIIVTWFGDTQTLGTQS